MTRRRHALVAAVSGLLPALLAFGVTSMRSAIAVGALTVLVVLIATTTWREYQASVELEQVE